nr:hypothetical protein [Tanacetum cinerariifolium]
MLVVQEVGEDANKVHAEDVNAAGVVAQGAGEDDNAAKVRSAQRIDTSDDTVMDDLSKQGGIIANIDADEDVVLEDAKDVAVKKSADVKDNADIHGRKAESQTDIYKIDLEHAKKVLSI